MVIRALFLIEKVSYVIKNEETIYHCKVIIISFHTESKKSKIIIQNKINNLQYSL